MTTTTTMGKIKPETVQRYVDYLLEVQSLLAVGTKLKWEAIRKKHHTSAQVKRTAIELNILEDLGGGHFKFVPVNVTDELALSVLKSINNDAAEYQRRRQELKKEKAQQEEKRVENRKEIDNIQNEQVIKEAVKEKPKTYSTFEEMIYGKNGQAKASILDLEKQVATANKLLDQAANVVKEKDEEIARLKATINLQNAQMADLAVKHGY